MTRTQAMTRLRLCLLAASSVLAVSFAASANAQSITVVGKWQTDPDFPQGPNQLQGWLQKDFSLQLAWPAGLPVSSNEGGYPADKEGYSKAWVWQDAANVHLTVDGVAPHALASPLTYLQLTNDFSYDGSQGLLDAGIYDVFELSGMSDLCPAAGQLPYWGTCVASPGYPDRYTYSILLIGPQHTFSNAPDLPNLSQIASANWLVAGAAVNFYVDGGIDVGAVESLTVLSPLHSQSLLISLAVPEPSSYALLLIGLGLIGVATRRNASARSSDLDLGRTGTSKT